MLDGQIDLTRQRFGNQLTVAVNGRPLVTHETGSANPYDVDRLQEMFLSGRGREVGGVNSVKIVKPSFSGRMPTFLGVAESDKMHVFDAAVRQCSAKDVF